MGGNIGDDQMQDTHEMIEVQALPPEEIEHDLLSPDARMLLLTWVTFLLLLIVLYKFAWKPILKALDDREALIRKAVDEAEKTREELARVHTARQAMIAEAERKAKEIVREARQAAIEASHVIEHKAKEEAQILLENARRDIREETEKAQVILRKESAAIAVALAGKLIEKNLDDAHNRKLVNEFIERI